MTTMARFVPLRSSIHEMAALQNRLSSILNESARPGEAEDSSDAAVATSSFVPAVDIYEDAQALVLQVETPGISQDDLDVRIENQKLTIKGERKLDASLKQEGFHRIERRFGSFARTFTLPQSVDTEFVTAAYDSGVLTITLAKKAEAKPRQVKIETGVAVQRPGQAVVAPATHEPEIANAATGASAQPIA